MSKNLMVVSLIAAVLLASCQTFREKSEETKLNDILRQYEKNLRWGSLSNIYSFLDADSRKQTSVPADLDNVKVTRVNRLSPVVPISETSVTLKISIDYVFEDEQVERTLVDEQVWEQQLGEWYRANAIPRFE